MSNIIRLFPNNDVPTGLRHLAEDIEAGKFENKGCTVICGTEVFHIGDFTDEEAASEAIWDMTYGIHKLMYTAVRED